MNAAGPDRRLLPPQWSAAPPRRRLWLSLLVALALPLAVWYFGWLLHPDRVGHPVLYGLLIAAELFNLVQAVGFWWTSTRKAPAERTLPLVRKPHVDVFVPVYGEPVEIVEPTIALANTMSDAHVSVHLLDDGGSDEMEALARRHRAGYIRREGSEGAKAGNINHALELTSGEFVVVLDSDHVPSPRFLERTLPAMLDERMAFVQTPQYYANAGENPIADASWAQQALFFGPIARGKGALGAAFCCGTNVVFRRSALESVGGFPTDSLTEDFELSVALHERGWRSTYLPVVLASGLGPEDMASYVSQQQRWARGCLAGGRSALRARLPFRLRLQYLLSSMYFLSGWTVLIYMSFPVVRILTGAQPIAPGTADQFLVHFVPYFAVALTIVAAAGAGAFTFGAFALAAASFWIHVQASLRALAGVRGRFVVTPKQGAAGRQPRAVAPALVVVAILLGVSVYGLVRSQSPSTLNNVAFAALHVTIVLSGAWAALRPPGAARGDSGGGKAPVAIEAGLEELARAVAEKRERQPAAALSVEPGS